MTITFSAFVIVGLSYIKICRLIRTSCIICAIFLNLSLPRFPGGNLCSAQKANFRYFSVDEGLPQATVYDMLLDNEGYLWFGTQGGIARYNGKAFDVYNRQNGLAGNHVVKLYQDSKNNIWIGYRYEGVSKLVLPVPPSNSGGNEGEGSLSMNRNNDKKGDSSPPMAEFGTRFYHYKDQLSGIDKAISDILEDDLGNIWIGTKGNGIYLLNKAIKEKGKIKELTTENGFRSNNIVALEKDESGNIWIGTDEGIHIINPNDPDKILKEIFLSDFGFQNNYIRDIKIDEVERISSAWVAALSGVCELNFDSDLNIKIKNKYEDIDGLPLQLVKQLYIANISHQPSNINHPIVWLATSNGVIRFENGIFKRFTEKEGLSNNIVSSIIEDRESNIWIGVWGSGVCQYLGDNFEIFDKETGLPDNIVHAVLIDKDYSLWVGTEKGITRYLFSDTLMNSITGVDHFTVDDGLSDNDVKCMYQDTRNFIWIGTKTSVSRYDPVKRTFKNFAKIKALKKKRVITINEDKNGNIWLCDLGTGCVKFNIGQNKIISSEQFNKENGFFSNLIWTVYKDRKGNLWFGSNDAGLAVYDGENFVIINEQQGLTHRRPGSITEDKYGNLWVGSIGGGVYKMENGKWKMEDGKWKFDGMEFTNYTTRDGISSDNPYLIVGDNIGNVWIGTNTGVDQLNVSTGKIRHYGKSEGFLGIETNQNAVYKDPLGNIWFGTIKGLVKCNPSSFKENLVEPVTAIKNVRIFLKDEAIPEKNIFPYNKNHLTFDFTGISYSNPDRVKFQYMLEGFDKEWSPPTNEHLATYSNIPPGKYRFLLVASNSDGIRNKQPAIFGFEITPPFWRTWWFYSLCAIMALLSVYVFIKRRERMLKLSKITLEKTVMQRTTELKRQNTKLKEANNEIKIKNKLIIDSILYAKRIQEATLPSFEQIEKKLL